MLIRTRSFGFSSGRAFGCDSRWWKRTISIGFGEVVERFEYGIPYRFCIHLMFWLVPDFIRHQHFLGTENGEPVYQVQIVGIHNWPFSFHVSR